MRRACAGDPISGGVAIFPVLGQLIVEERLRSRARLVQRPMHEVYHGRRGLRRLVLRLAWKKRADPVLVICLAVPNDELADYSKIDAAVSVAVLRCLASNADLESICHAGDSNNPATNYTIGLFLLALQCFKLLGGISPPLSAGGFDV